MVASPSEHRVRASERLLQEADNNNDGAVDFNEYMNWWGKLGKLQRTPYTFGVSYRNT